MVKTFYINHKLLFVGSRAYKALKNIVENRRLLSDIEQLSPDGQTSSIESFHAVLCLFTPKFLHYFYRQMEAR